MFASLINCGFVCLKVHCFKWCDQGHVAVYGNTLEAGRTTAILEVPAIHVQICKEVNIAKCDVLLVAGTGNVMIQKVARVTALAVLVIGIDDARVAPRVRDLVIVLAHTTHTVIILAAIVTSDRLHLIYRILYSYVHRRSRFIPLNRWLHFLRRPLWPKL